MNLEKSARERGLGKWGDPTFPKRGWRCEYVEDTGDLSATCEMCETADIRYVHTLIHPVQGTLNTGCICAAHLTGEYDKHKRNERKLKSRGRALAAWRRKHWHTSAKGNHWCKHNGYRITIFRRKPAGWGWVANTPDGEEYFGRATYVQPQDAEDDIFEFINPRKIIIPPPPPPPRVSVAEAKKAFQRYLDSKGYEPAIDVCMVNHGELLGATDSFTLIEDFLLGNPECKDHEDALREYAFNEVGQVCNYYSGEPEFDDDAPEEEDEPKEKNHDEEESQT